MATEKVKSDLPSTKGMSAALNFSEAVCGHPCLLTDIASHLTPVDILDELTYIVSINNSEQAQVIQHKTNEWWAKEKMGEKSLSSPSLSKWYQVYLGNYHPWRDLSVDKLTQPNTKFVYRAVHQSLLHESFKSHPVTKNNTEWSTRPEGWAFQPETNALQQLSKLFLLARTIAFNNEFLDESLIQFGFAQFLAVDYNKKGDVVGIVMSYDGKSFSSPDAPTLDEEHDVNAFQTFLSKTLLRMHASGVTHLTLSPEAIHFKRRSDDYDVISSFIPAPESVVLTEPLPAGDAGNPLSFRIVNFSTSHLQMPDHAMLANNAIAGKSLWHHQWYETLSPEGGSTNRFSIEKFFEKDIASRFVAFPQFYNAKRGYIGEVGYEAPEIMLQDADMFNPFAVDCFAAGALLASIVTPALACPSPSDGTIEASGRYNLLSSMGSQPGQAWLDVIAFNGSLNLPERWLPLYSQPVDTSGAKCATDAGNELYDDGSSAYTVDSDTTSLSNGMGDLSPFNLQFLYCNRCLVRCENKPLHQQLTGNGIVADIDDYDAVKTVNEPFMCIQCRPSPQMPFRLWEFNLIMSRWTQHSNVGKLGSNLQSLRVECKSGKGLSYSTCQAAFIEKTFELIELLQPDDETGHCLVSRDFARKMASNDFVNAKLNDWWTSVLEVIAEWTPETTAALAKSNLQPLVGYICGAMPLIASVRGLTQSSPAHRINAFQYSNLVENCYGKVGSPIDDVVGFFAQTFDAEDGQQQDAASANQFIPTTFDLMQRTLAYVSLDEMRPVSLVLEDKTAAQTLLIEEVLVGFTQVRDDFIGRLQTFFDYDLQPWIPAMMTLFDGAVRVLNVTDKAAAILLLHACMVSAMAPYLRGPLSEGIPLESVRFYQREVTRELFDRLLPNITKFSIADACPFWDHTALNLPIPEDVPIDILFASNGESAQSDDTLRDDAFDRSISKQLAEQHLDPRRSSANLYEDDDEPLSEEEASVANRDTMLDMLSFRPITASCSPLELYGEAHYASPVSVVISGSCDSSHPLVVDKSSASRAEKSQELAVLTRETFIGTLLKQHVAKVSVESEPIDLGEFDDELEEQDEPSVFDMVIQSFQNAIIRSGLTFAQQPPILSLLTEHSVNDLSISDLVYNWYAWNSNNDCGGAAGKRSCAVMATLLSLHHELCGATNIDEFWAWYTTALTLNPAMMNVDILHVPKVAHSAFSDHVVNSVILQHTMNQIPANFSSEAKQWIKRIRYAANQDAALPKMHTFDATKYNNTSISNVQPRMYGFLWPLPATRSSLSVSVFTDRIHVSINEATLLWVYPDGTPDWLDNIFDMLRSKLGVSQTETASSSKQ